jgi:ribosomal protein S18 acetylase RimI-like enzyme
LIADFQKPVIEFEQVTGPNRLEELKQLFLDYNHSLNIDLAFQDFETELKTLPGKYAPPDGVLILALLNGQGAGCIALRKISENIGEMKRLYVRDEFRGLGIGRKLISIVIEEAKRLNYRYVRLDTLETLRNALSLYKAFGFYDIAPYVYNPIEGARFMELELNV